MKITDYGQAQVVGKLPGQEKKTSQDASKAFGQALTEAVGKVNEAHNKATEEVTGLAAGQHNRLHETMMTVEQADLSMKLLVAVRNKALDAYRELMRMSN